MGVDLTHLRQECGGEGGRLHRRVWQSYCACLLVFLVLLVCPKQNIPFAWEGGEEEGIIVMRAPPVKLFKLFVVNWVRIVFFFSPLSKSSKVFGHIPRKINYKQQLIFLCFLSLKAIKIQWNWERVDLLKFPKGRASFRITLLIWKPLLHWESVGLQSPKTLVLMVLLSPWKNAEGSKKWVPTERSANIRSVLELGSCSSI